MPQKINNSFTYLHKYLQASAENKHKEDMYVSQLNSIADLEQRVKITTESIQKTADRLKKTQEHVLKARESLKQESQAKMQECMELNQQILHKIRHVYSKLDRALMNSPAQNQVNRLHQTDLLAQQELTLLQMDEYTHETQSLARVIQQSPAKVAA